MSSIFLILFVLMDAILLNLDLQKRTSYKKIFFESLHFSLTFLHHISKIWRQLIFFWSILILAMCVRCGKLLPCAIFMHWGKLYNVIPYSFIYFLMKSNLTLKYSFRSMSLQIHCSISHVPLFVRDVRFEDKCCSFAYYRKRK